MIMRRLAATEVSPPWSRHRIGSLTRQIVIGIRASMHLTDLASVRGGGTCAHCTLPPRLAAAGAAVTAGAPCPVRASANSFGLQQTDYFYFLHALLYLFGNDVTHTFGGTLCGNRDATHHDIQDTDYSEHTLRRRVPGLFMEYSWAFCL
jgi:hypothetical protein